MPRHQDVNQLAHQIVLESTEQRADRTLTRLLEQALELLDSDAKGRDERLREILQAALASIELQHR